MAERNLSVDHVTIWRWVQRYAPVLNQRVRRELRRPNRSWRIDETYVKVAGSWTYLYRAIDSAGQTIEFMLSPKRDLVAAKLFLRLALSGGGPPPRVINVDGHPAYPTAIAEFEGIRGNRQTVSLSNGALSEQHHRAGPSVYQKADHCEPRVPIGGGRVSNDRGLRSDACHPQRPSPVGRQRGFRRPARLHPHPLRGRRIDLRRACAHCPQAPLPCLQQNPSDSRLRRRGGIRVESVPRNDLVCPASLGIAGSRTLSGNGMPRLVATSCTFCARRAQAAYRGRPYVYMKNASNQQGGHNP